jgi:hypothetical protein
MSFICIKLANFCRGPDGRKSISNLIRVGQTMTRNQDDHDDDSSVDIDGSPPAKDTRPKILPLNAAQFYQLQAEQSYVPWCVSAPGKELYVIWPRMANTKIAVTITYHDALKFRTHSLAAAISCAPVVALNGVDVPKMTLTFQVRLPWTVDARSGEPVTFADPQYFGYKFRRAQSEIGSRITQLLMPQNSDRE